MGSLINLENISFSYGNNSVIKNLNLQIEEGSFTTLLGESGCGKTTLLRLLAGFLEPDTGTIKINGKVVNGVLPDKRQVGMVFQDYALFPHMTVEQNLLYGLKLKKDIKKSDYKEIVNQTSKILGIEALLNRYPSELSGGQQQRVALGRSLVLKPKVLLMDEPLSSLDANLRGRVREELKDIQQKLGITTVYVTHDQEEAFFLSDKIAVVKNGQILQYATSKDLYYSPADTFVAEFVGKANFVQLDNKNCLVRPEWIEVEKSSAKEGDYKANIESVCFLGDITRLKLNVKELDMQIIADKKTLECSDFSAGDSVSLRFLRSWAF